MVARFHLTVIGSILALTSLYRCAEAQVSPEASAFFDKLLNSAGGVLWTSTGWPAPGQDGCADQQVLRGGFAISIRPPNEPDTIWTTTGKDSSSLWIRGPGLHDSVRVRRSVEIVSVKRGDPQPFTVSLGYMFSGTHRINDPSLTADLRPRGTYLGIFKSGPVGKTRLAWVAGVAAEFLELPQAVGETPSGRVTLSAGRTVAPEFYLGSTLRGDGRQAWFVEVSFQYLRIPSIDYKSIDPSALTTSEIAMLPQDITLRSWHVTVGTTFSFKGSFY